MHHALEIEEILLTVFRHCDVLASLASLARTCRTFKEPALDVLWQELDDLSPLMRCLPEAFYQTFYPDPMRSKKQRSLVRQLTAIEYDILQSYTRRVQSIKRFESGIHENSMEILLNSPTTGPLFPNLRSLRCSYVGSQTTYPLLQHPFPSLTSLFIMFSNPYLFQNCLRLFSEVSHNISYLGLRMISSDAAFNQSVSNCICRWRNLQAVDCPQVTLDMDALEHLSRVPTLTSLILMLSVTSMRCSSTLVFSNLLYLRLRSPSLGSISQLLSQVQLSAITAFIVRFDSPPSKQDLAFFLACVRTSNISNTLEHLEWYQSVGSGDNARTMSLCPTDLQPCTTFNNIHRVRLDMECSVDVGYHNLLALASAWPCLRELQINPSWGWDTPDGITPNGLSQLLQHCRSLCRVALAMDVRGYTEFHPGATCGATFPREFRLDVLDSKIEAESVPAVAAFLAAMEPCPRFILNSWRGIKMVKMGGWLEYRGRWADVAERSRMQSVRAVERLGVQSTPS